jgi:hypothetical protein
MSRPIITAVLSGFLLSTNFGGLVLADAPATQPAAGAVDTSTPMKFLVSYDQLAGQGPESYRALYSIDANDDSQRLAEVESKFDAEVGMLQKISRLLWGDDGVDQTLHALGLKTMTDIQSATIKQTGDRATITFADGTVGPELVKTPAGWRLDLAAFRQSLGIPVDDYLKQIRQLSKVVPGVADGIADGKLKNPSAVVSDIVKRINAVAK